MWGVLVVIPLIKDQLVPFARAHLGSIAFLLAFGRAIGDAASVLFTAGYTESLPTSLFRPGASLPLAVFFQLGTPLPKVQQRAYAAAVILTIIVLVISLLSRLLTRRLTRHIMR